MPFKNKEPEHYRRWVKMRNRCNNINNYSYKNYGGRGIKVCSDWDNFKTFQEWCLKNYKEGHTLDRVDNNKGYSPDNCKFSTPTEQNNNRRLTPKMLSCYEKQGVRLSTFSGAMYKKKYGDPKTRTTKFCKKCSEFLSTSLFYKCKKSSDGLDSYCKKCQNIRYKEWYSNRTRARKKLP